MAHNKKLALALASLSLLGAGAAHAVDIPAGDWKLSIGGNVNGFITSDSCEKNAKNIAFGLACTGDSTFGIQNGLLPNEISFSASTRQDDLDINATISLWPTITTQSAGQTNAGGLNSRQGFFTFGDKSWGTVKIGRDLGLFGSDAILSDMTLLSVGGGSGSTVDGGGNHVYGGPTTLGRIGEGYLYADWIPQVTYSTPNLNGFTASAGVFQGLANLTTAGYTSLKQPGVQAKAAYDFSGSGVNAHVWVGFLTQKLDVPAGTTNGPAGYSASAGEIGAKVDIADFQAVAYYYDADGVGTTLEFLGGDDGQGNKRKSKGGYLQGTYKIGKVKLGLSYGESKLDGTSYDQSIGYNLGSVATPTYLLSKNDSSIASLYYSLTKSITLVGEYIHTSAKDQVGNENKQDTIALGGIIFF